MRHSVWEGATWYCICTSGIPAMSCCESTIRSASDRLAPNCSSRPSGAPESSPREAMAVPHVMSRTQAVSRALNASTRSAYSTASVIVGVSVFRIWQVATDRCT